MPISQFVVAYAVDRHAPMFDDEVGIRSEAAGECLSQLMDSEFEFIRGMNVRGSSPGCNTVGIVREVHGADRGVLRQRTLLAPAAHSLAAR